MEEIENISSVNNPSEEDNVKYLKNKQNTKRKKIQAVLFLLTLLCTTLAGAEWSCNKYLTLFGRNMSFEDFLQGFHFSIPFLIILTSHEFGHYFTARYHKVEATLPYYIPAWFGFIGSPSLGTFGAVIRITGKIKSRIQYFDIGIAGPIAGFFVALLFLWYGFTHLPPPEYIFTIHPEYAQYGLDYPKYVYADTPTPSFTLGTNILFEFFKNNIADLALLPNERELIHYPYIFSGFLALFFTALNLIPIGQLDGGHVVYGLFGYKNSRIISLSLYFIFLFYASLGIISPYTLFDNQYSFIVVGIYIIYLFFISGCITANKKTRYAMVVSFVTGQLVFSYFFPTIIGEQGWLLYLFILGKFLGIFHPRGEDESELGLKRKILGWVSLLIFILCFSFQPIK